MNDSAPFIFYTERRLVLLTGRKASDLRELLAHLEAVSGASIFYHTHHQFLSHHFEKPVFYNDFANWVGRALQEQRLAEKLTAVDLLAFTSVRQVREAIAAAISGHLVESGGLVRQCPPGDEFHFCESQSFIMPTGIVAPDVADFFPQLPRVSNVSLFFHFFEARLRLERPTNDFSQWLRYRGQEKAADRIDQLDPYLMTLDELRDRIIQVGRESGLA
jgi:hypothetical protein